MLRASPVRGRDFATGDEGAAAGRVAILGHSLWQRRFGGDTGLVGRSITLNSESFTIVGVMPAGFQFPEKAELWTLAKNVVPANPFIPASVDIKGVRGMHYLYVIARLKDGVSPEDIVAAHQIDHRRGLDRQNLDLFAVKPAARDDPFSDSHP